MLLLGSIKGSKAALFRLAQHTYFANTFKFDFVKCVSIFKFLIMHFEVIGKSAVSLGDDAVGFFQVDFNDFVFN